MSDELSLPKLGECAICSELAPENYAFQKNGWPDRDSYLPAASAKLVLVRNLRLYGSRRLELQQCPICATYYLYRTDYEFLAGGTEDEDFLTRLTDAQAAEYLASTPCA